MIKIIIGKDRGKSFYQQCSMLISYLYVDGSLYGLRLTSFKSCVDKKGVAIFSCWRKRQLTNWGKARKGGIIVMYIRVLATYESFWQKIYKYEVVKR